MENLFKLLKDEKAETEIIINNSVVGIETLLNIISIISQNKKEKKLNKSKWL